MPNEFVVIEVLTPYVGVEGTDFAGWDRWLDYSRCTAVEAHSFLQVKDRKKYRAKHWISGDMLTDEQLAAMCVTPEKWESKPPKV